MTDDVGRKRGHSNDSVRFMRLGAWLSNHADTRVPGHRSCGCRCRDCRGAGDACFGATTAALSEIVGGGRGRQAGHPGAGRRTPTAPPAASNEPEQRGWSPSASGHQTRPHGNVAPSTGIAIPVKKDESSLARNSAAAANSDGSPKQPMGCPRRSTSGAELVFRRESPVSHSEELIIRR